MIDIDQLVLTHGGLVIEAIELFLRNPDNFCRKLPASENAYQNVGLLKSYPRERFAVSVEPLQLSELIRVENGLELFPHYLVMFAMEHLSLTTATPKVNIGAFGAYSLDSGIIGNVSGGGYLGGALFGYRYFTEAAKKVLVEIQICDAQGDVATGTGFICSLGDAKRWIATCKHNIIQSNGANNKIIELKSDLGNLSSKRALVSSNYDFSFLEIDVEIDTVALRFTNGKTLDKVVSAGFPKILLSEASPLLFHRGELNGWVGNVESKNLKIVTSCDVAPGSSGGPLINEVGLVVGIISERVETSTSQGKANYSLAVPTQGIEAELVAGLKWFDL
jgi:Trypsin-like peptidase domain